MYLCTYHDNTKILKNEKILNLKIGTEIEPIAFIIKQRGTLINQQ